MCGGGRMTDGETWTLCSRQAPKGGKRGLLVIFLGLLIFLLFYCYTLCPNPCLNPGCDHHMGLSLIPHIITKSYFIITQ